MKAWTAKRKDEFYTTVVFAETRGKARSLAMRTNTCEGTDFCDIEVSRVPQMDKYYKEGKREMDWNAPQDRIALVKDCSFHCEYVEPYMCKDCSAKEFCDEYQEYLEEEEGVQG